MGTGSGNGRANDAPLLSSLTVSAQGLGQFLAHIHLSLMEGQSEWKNRGATCTNVAVQVEIGQPKCLLKGWLHPGRGIQRIPMEGKAS